MRTWIGLCSFALIAMPGFAGDMGSAITKTPQGGFFLGLGGSYNLVEVNQYSWGQGISNVYLGSTLLSYGIAEGTGAPFHNTTARFSPEVQAGYFKHFANSDKIYGVKFAYQYLGATSTNNNLYIPQLGQLNTVSPPSTSSLFGYVNADAVEVTTNHEFTLLAFIGQTFQDNKYVYLGVGPSLFTLQSHNYYSIGYANFNGENVDITGLVSYSSPSIWAFGGAAQLGMTYFIDPSWFLDLSYTYTFSGQYTAAHEQPFVNSFVSAGTTYTTSGNLFTRNTMQITSQAVTLAINKFFDY